MKYVLVDEYKELIHYPFNSELDIDTLKDQLTVLNDIAINEISGIFYFNDINLITIQACYVEDYYNIYTLENWFIEYKIN